MIEPIQNGHRCIHISIFSRHFFFAIFPQFFKLIFHNILVSRQFDDAMIFAITPNKRCVGIIVFPESYDSDINGNVQDDLEGCIASAIELKESIEYGTLMCDIKQHPRIIQNPDTSGVDMQSLVQLRAQSKIYANFYFSSGYL